MTDDYLEFDIIIVGAALVGSSLACLLSRMQPTWRIALIDATAFKQQTSLDYDARSIVLTYGSQQIFEALNIWPELMPYAHAIKQLHMTEQGRLGRTRIQAAKQRVPALGYVIESYHLLQQLQQTLKQYPQVRWFCPATWQALSYQETTNHLVIDQDGQLTTLVAPLLVAADGAQSNIRSHYDIAVDVTEFKQTAIVMNLNLKDADHNIARERLTTTGPITLLPLYDGRHAMIWIVKESDAQRLMAYDDSTFMQCLHKELCVNSGQLVKIGRRVSYPLKEAVAQQALFPGGVLLGNAAHALHPMGAQGFNLGLRDTLELCQCLSSKTDVRAESAVTTAAVTSIETPSNTATHIQLALASYVKKRLRDQRVTTQHVRRLSRLFTSNKGAVKVLRACLLGIAQLPPVQSYITRQAIGLGHNIALPRLPTQPSSKLSDIPIIKYHKCLATHYDVVIVGGGIVGATMAIALARTPLKVALLDKRTMGAEDLESYDPRVSAITLSSQRILHNLGVWPLIATQRMTPYQHMSIWDSTTQQHVDFNAAEVDQPQLGWIVENKILLQALWQRLQTASHVDLGSEVNCEQLALMEEHAALETNQGRITASLLVGADGALSWVRDQAQIAVQEYDYQQIAIVATVKLARSHEFTAWQCFMPTGPLALLPLDDSHYGTIIWSCDTPVAQAHLKCSMVELGQLVSNKFEQRFGAVTLQSEAHAVPLRMRHAKQYVSSRLALIGDAAHTIHPLAGQGVNLGLLDAACLAQIIQDALAASSGWSSLKVLRQYERWRRTDNATMIAAMKIFKHSFAYTQPLIQGVRKQGMRWVNQMQCLKQMLMQHAMGYRSELPRYASISSDDSY